MSDADWMRRAIEVGARGTRAVRPNPRVGCVLVKDGEEIAAGYHARCGGPHAEAVALELAGDRARGATAYVTLEPCNHFGRTPPCAKALIEAGIARVVVGVADPHPQAAGGADTLRQAGVEVVVGVEVEAAWTLAEVFLTNLALGRPFVYAKVAQTLDGRIAAADGTSRWITGLEARRYVHELRAESDAVLVGSGTALADDPRLDLRELPPERHDQPPLRVVLDRRLRLPLQAHLCDTQRQATLVLVDRPEAEASEAAARLRQRGVEVACVRADSSDGEQGWLPGILRYLHARGVCQVLVESGTGVTTALLRQGLVDRLDLLIAAKLLGSGPLAIGDLGVQTLAQARSLRWDTVTRLGEDVRLGLVARMVDKQVH